MKKTLILFSDLYSTGGLQQYNRHLYRALKEGFKSVDFKILSFRGSKINIFKKIEYIFKAVAMAFVHKPQFIICAHVDLAPLALFLKKAFKIKYVVLTHGTDCWYKKGGIKYKGLKKADIIVTVSRYSKDRMISNGIDRHKIKLLYNTVNTSVFCQKPIDFTLLNKLGLENKRILLTVGRVDSRERYKGHDIMIEVLKRLEDTYAWLVVGGGDDVSRLKQKAAEFGVLERIRFLKEISNEELSVYYNLCDCFAMPSSGEGFGIVFLEAMACGKPVIGGNRDGSREPLMDGKLGFLVNPDSAKEIVHAIHLACSTKEKRTDSEYLKREVEANFGTRVFNRKTKEIFSAVL